MFTCVVCKQQTKFARNYRPAGEEPVCTSCDYMIENAADQLWLDSMRAATSFRVYELVRKPEIIALAERAAKDPEPFSAFVESAEMANESEHVNLACEYYFARKRDLGEELKNQ